MSSQEEQSSSICFGSLHIPTPPADVSLVASSKPRSQTKVVKEYSGSSRLSAIDLDIEEEENDDDERRYRQYHIIPQIPRVQPHCPILTNEVLVNQSSICSTETIGLLRSRPSMTSTGGDHRIPSLASQVTTEDRSSINSTMIGGPIVMGNEDSSFDTFPEESNEYENNNRRRLFQIPYLGEHLKEGKNKNKNKEEQDSILLQLFDQTFDDVLDKNEQPQPLSPPTENKHDSKMLITTPPPKNTSMVLDEKRPQPFSPPENKHEPKKFSAIFGEGNLVGANSSSSFGFSASNQDDSDDVGGTSMFTRTPYPPSPITIPKLLSSPSLSSSSSHSYESTIAKWNFRDVSPSDDDTCSLNSDCSSTSTSTYGHQDSGTPTSVSYSSPSMNGFTMSTLSEDALIDDYFEQFHLAGQRRGGHGGGGGGGGGGGQHGLSLHGSRGSKKDNIDCSSSNTKVPQRDPNLSPYRKPPKKKSPKTLPLLKNNKLKKSSSTTNKQKSKQKSKQQKIPSPCQNKRSLSHEPIPKLHVSHCESILLNKNKDIKNKLISLNLSSFHHPTTIDEQHFIMSPPDEKFGEVDDPNRPGKTPCPCQPKKGTIQTRMRGGFGAYCKLCKRELQLCLLCLLWIPYGTCDKHFLKSGCKGLPQLSNREYSFSKINTSPISKPIIASTDIKLQSLEPIHEN